MEHSLSLYSPDATGRFPSRILENPGKTFLRLEKEWERQSLRASSVLTSTSMNANILAPYVIMRVEILTCFAEEQCPRGPWTL